MFGAVAAGAELGGFDSIADASRQMARLSEEWYVPNPANRGAYDQLYAEYRRLHDLFGRGRDEAMKRLRLIQRAVIESPSVG